jgi:hypothetical protein
MVAQVMPEHHPSLVEVGEKMHVQYEVWYDVAHASPELEHSLSDTIKGRLDEILPRLPLHAQTTTRVREG